MQLVIPLSRTDEPVYRQVYGSIREAILSGQLEAGDRLPSTRELAEQLGISRTVVVLAYELLLAEGYAESRSGSGTFVTAGLSPSHRAGTGDSARLRLARYGSFAAEIASAVNFPVPPNTPLRYDFAYGRSDMECFPFKLWRRTLMRRARKGLAREINYGAAGGSEALRAAICDHVRSSRAVVCDPSQIIVVNGSQQALDLVARVLIERGDRIVIEDPCYQGTREVLRAAGARLHPVGVDRDGLDTDALPKRARAAFVTPSHQFPTGGILPLKRRQALIEWAHHSNAVIVEDDYDGEFHYGGRPLESLQGLDREGRVLYVGTFSRTIFPALRIGYLIVPKPLVSPFTAAKWLCDRHTATLEQEALAEFMNVGAYARHLRRVRRKNSENREALLEAVQRYLGGRADLTGDAAGAHIVLWPRRRAAEGKIVAAAAARSVGVYGISGYYVGQARRAGLLLGYSQMHPAEIREGIRLLGEII